MSVSSAILGMSTPPMLYWKLNEALNATTVLDYSSSGIYTGTVAGNGFFNQPGIVTTEGLTCWEGGSGNPFHSTGLNATISSNVAISNASQSFSLLGVMEDADGTTPYSHTTPAVVMGNLLTTWPTGSGCWIQLGSTATGTNWPPTTGSPFLVGFWGDTNGNVQGTSRIGIALGSPYFIVLTVDASTGTATFYLNGVVAWQSNGYTGIPVNVNKQFFAGPNCRPTYFQHLAYVDGAITADDVKSVWAAISGAAVPVISGRSPVSGPTTGGTTVTITGSNFTTATAVKFGATPAVYFSITDDSTIQAVSPVGTASTVDIRVTTPAATSAITSNDQFTFSGPGGGGSVVNTPVVTSISPSSGSAAGGTVVTINGSNFDFITGVSFGGTAAKFFTVASSTKMTAVSPGASAGAVHITVTNSAGTSATSGADQFTFTTAVSAGGCRWRFDDPVDNSFYVFEANPNEGGSPSRTRAVKTVPTTAGNGNVMVYQGAEQPQQLEWSGSMFTANQLQQFWAWANKNHQIQLTDDLGRIYMIIIKEFTPKRVRSSRHPDKRTYSMKASIVSW